MTEQPQRAVVGHVITAEQLPGLLADIARITTPEIAIAVARQHGGRRLYIPRTPPIDHPLCDLVGRQAALLIAEHLGGDRYEVPAARTILRWADAHRFRAQGMSHAQISQALGITRDHVAQLLAGAPIGEIQAAKAMKAKVEKPRDGRQMTLF